MSIVEKLAKAAADGAVSAIDRNMDSIVETAMASIFNHPWYPFIAGAQMCLIEHGMKPLAAWGRAREVCINYVKDEKLKFGADTHDWSWRGGYDVALDCEVEYWDAEP